MTVLRATGASGVVGLMLALVACSTSSDVVTAHMDAAAVADATGDPGSPAVADAETVATDAAAIDAAGDSDADGAAADGGATAADGMVADSGTPDANRDAGADGKASDGAADALERDGAGACVSICAIGATECLPDGLASCVTGANGCPGWSFPTACGPHQTCGVAADGGAACICNSASTCTAVGPICANGTDIEMCSLDTNGCLFVSTPAAACTGGGLCSGPPGDAGCCNNDPTCAQAGRVCTSATDIETCSVASNGCLVVSTPAAACATHEVCSGAAGDAGCTCSHDPTCTRAGQVCASTSDIETCSTDSNGCLFVSTPPAACTTSVANALADCTGNTCGISCQPTFHACGVGASETCMSNSSPQSCGVSCTPCVHPANATATCSGAPLTCGFACTPGFHQCGSSCANNTSTTTCGTTCTPCVLPTNGATVTCDGTACGFTCKGGYVPCGGACVDEQTDNQNCGGCGVVCPCSAGQCLTAVSISAGRSHTCAVLSNGTAECWGDNAYGELGDGTNTGPQTCGSSGGTCSTIPARVSGLTGVTAIAAGSSYTCALLSGGSVECWGLNSSGQLGDGTSTGPATCGSALEACSPTPVALAPFTVVTPTPPALAIAAGGAHACALLSGGLVQCWGANNSGQLGDGVTSNSSYPAAMSDSTANVTGATAVAASNTDTCIVLPTGTVECSGDDVYGELGNEASAPQMCGSSPCAKTVVAIPGLAGVVAIAGGGSHACALLSGGTVECWGLNASGELGEATSTGPQYCNLYPCSTGPVTVPGLSGVTAIAAGSSHTCALLSGGTVECWGLNSSGQLGDGTSSGPRTCNSCGLTATCSSPCSTTPVAVSGLTGATAIAAGGVHTCALLSSGAVMCWGNNSVGQLGNGTTDNSSRPVSVSGL